MQQALESLQRAIQHALALGLNRAGGLEPLLDALRALQPHDALAPLAECLQAALTTDDARAQLNALTRLHYACRRLLEQLEAQHLLHQNADAAPPSGTENPQAARHELEPFARLFRGEAALIETLPAIRAQVEAWLPDQPPRALLLTLAHCSTARLAQDRLRTLGDDALPALIQLANSKSPIVRLRACELLLEHSTLKATAALRAALPRVPRALPLFQKLRARPDLQPLFVKEDAPSVEQWLSAFSDRRQVPQMLQKTETQLMLLPTGAPVLDALLEKIRALAANELDLWRMCVRVPHEQITQMLFRQPQWLRSLCYEHFLATLDERLIPILLSVYPQFWSEQMRQLTRFPDAAFLPYAVRGHPSLLPRFGEPAELIQGAN